MRDWGQDYDPNEMLSLTKVDPFRYRDNLTSCVSQILAVVATEKDERRLIERIEEVVHRHSQVSIGAALERLHSVATIGPELYGGRTGIDALAYHLSGGNCENGISALKAVLRKFDELDGRSSVEPPAPKEEQYEYEITKGPRKGWDGSPDLSKDGWEEYQPWERFDYHEERYWRRKLS